MKTSRAVVFVFLLAVVCEASTEVAHAQVGNSGGLPYQQRFLEEQLRPLIQPELRTPPPEQPFLYDYGAVLRYTGVWYEDHGPAALAGPNGDRFQASRAVHQWDFRPWMSASYEGVHNGFVRGQFAFLQYHDGDSFDRNSDWQGPFVDLGYYHLDVDQALRHYHGEESDFWAADFVLGRQFLFVGRGVALALNLDAVAADWQWDDWSGQIFGGQSIRHFNNIDLSVPGFDRSRREFFGAQLEYQALDRHGLYSYVVVQRDRSGESPDDPNQEYDYDSQYVGIGADGEFLFGPPECAVGIPNLRYFTEFIIQRGQSFGDGALADQDSIRSWAVDTGLTYYAPLPWKPRLLAEYARASGDADRRTPQNTVGGNRPGTTDGGFLGFGFLNTGVSFAPLFANLEFVRLSAAVRPFDQPCRPQCLRDLEFGTSGFFYWRPEKDAGVSDLRADIPGERYLGAEWDLFVNWRLSSDLYVLLNYGLFLPDEKSFSADRSRQLVSLSLNWLL